MRLCAATCARACAGRETSIWSMRFENAGRRHRVLTLEVDLATRTIRQAPNAALYLFSRSSVTLRATALTEDSATGGKLKLKLAPTCPSAAHRPVVKSNARHVAVQCDVESPGRRRRGMRRRPGTFERITRSLPKGEVADRQRRLARLKVVRDAVAQRQSGETAV